MNSAFAQGSEEWAEADLDSALFGAAGGDADLFAAPTAQETLVALTELGGLSGHSMPAAVSDKILAAISKGDSGDSTEPAPVASALTRSESSGDVVVGMEIREVFAWGIAAAACLFAVVSRFSADNAVEVPAEGGVGIVQGTEVPKANPEIDESGAVPVGASIRTAEELCQQLLEQAGDAVTVAWTAGQDSAVTGVVGGDVIWSAERQEGFMRIEGLAVNDPLKEQYQLWIFDAERDEAFPVDGGVFDMASETGIQTIPIRTPLTVGQASLFAVTVEQPGGVVVSSRERIALLAQL